MSVAVDRLPGHRRCAGGSVNGLLVSRCAVPSVLSRVARGRDARGIGAAPGTTTEPWDARTRVSVDVSGDGGVGGGKPNDVSTGAVGVPGPPGVVVYGSVIGTQVAIGSVPARKKSATAGPQPGAQSWPLARSICRSMTPSGRSQSDDAGRRR